VMAALAGAMLRFVHVRPALAGAYGLTSVSSGWYLTRPATALSPFAFSASAMSGSSTPCSFLKAEPARRLEPEPRTVGGLPEDHDEVVGRAPSPWRRRALRHRSGRDRRHILGHQ
jgi:hypothetical protein